MPSMERVKAQCDRVMQILREERDKRGLSGSKLADLCGVHQSTVSLLDRGLRQPSLDTLLRMAEVLEIELGEVLLRASAEEKAKTKGKNTTE